ncbi:MAG: endolytic transglycosylase MltG [Oscillospiraceae bacterium]|nr:endolytic transglycosylase MltG [Oscillospiraceae bacterium]
MPDVDKELEEIKKLIADSGSGPQPASNELVPARPRQAVTVKPKNPAPPQSAQPPAPKPAPRAIPQATPQREQSSPPTPVRKPNPQGVAPPSRQPAQGNVREFDISSDGMISKPAKNGGMREYDISPHGKVTKHKDEDLDIGDENFKLNFDFDGQYIDVPEERPVRVRREKRTGCIGGILYASFIISISLVLAVVLWTGIADVLGFGTIDEQVSITIPQDFEMEDVTELLYGAGLIRNRWLFNQYASFSDSAQRIVPGTFILNKNFDYRALVQGMTARAGARVETTVTIPEGFTLLQIFNLMEESQVVHSADDLWEAATTHDFNFHFLDSETIGHRYRLEGFLFPNTYNFFLGSQPVTVLNRLLREFDRQFTEAYVERAEEMGLTVAEIINIAAMIEREAGNDEERPRIAAVIYNRLESPAFPFLQIDATLSYAVQGTGLAATTDLDHPFNTYTNPGLPPWPIANPGIASIRAALFPLETDEYFYALNLEGTHNFFRTYPEHRSFVQSDQFGGWWR